MIQFDMQQSWTAVDNYNGCSQYVAACLRHNQIERLYGLHIIAKKIIY